MESSRTGMRQQEPQAGDAMPGEAHSLCPGSLELHLAQAERQPVEGQVLGSPSGALPQACGAYLEATCSR